ncbi:peptidoglycan-binding protein [Erythrobacter sp. JK5]|uniref:peptidoglycan-binding domain-containing protein n=1 Tax=Erythrobacter sp. JK5 TaxID=2829500 RepID=UPI001BADCEC5|nr:hypothetical protein [Erythrobacter sp. JK5]QUL38742.1 hypothetical protein KDC96_05025 [Erythrobacter sp. JK5]
MVLVPPSDYINWVKRSVNRLAGTEMAQDGLKNKEYILAVKGFQAYEGIPDNGEVDKRTQDHLIKANILVVEYCDWIRKVVTKELPGTPVGAGPWAKATDHAAVRTYQRKIGPAHGGLTVDGWVGPHTEFIMNRSSGITVPPTSKDPVYEFGDDVVTGLVPMTVDEIKATTWVIVGHEPKPNWMNALKVGFQFAKALRSFAKGSVTVPTPSIGDISSALGDPKNALIEADAMKGMAYGLVDFAFHKVRGNRELKAENVPGITTEGFAKGYRIMQRRLSHLHMRTDSNGKAIIARIKKETSKPRTMKHVYRGLFDVYQSKGALGGGHARVTKMSQRHCKFAYPEMSVECGPRGDLSE